MLLVSCEREERRYRELPPATARADAVVLSELRPGQGKDLPPPHTAASPPAPYRSNAYAVSEGKRLFTAYNCSGCHANGGGGIEPALMDDQWLYGSRPENIFATIVEGRPNGMPSFRGRIPDYQVWQLVSFVQSLSGQLPQDVAGGRSDHMAAKPSEQSTAYQRPKNVGKP
jgi:cytochrome c oxidase cbb3-type subunit 3